MSGFSYGGLILISMLCLFFVGGMIVNWGAFWQQTHRKEGERAWSSIGPIPGIAGSIFMFFGVGAAMKLGYDIPWPWLWILLPLFLDPFCLGWVLLIAFAAVFGAVFGRR
jgi:hypothetical protein